MEVAEAGRCPLQVVHDIGEDQPGLQGVHRVQGGPLRLVEEIPGDAPPGVRLGGGVVLGLEAEVGGDLAIPVPKESAGGADAEDERGRAQVDAVALAESGVDLADHGLHRRGMHHVTEAEVGVVEVVLEEGDGFFATGKVDAAV